MSGSNDTSQEQNNIDSRTNNVDIVEQIERNKQKQMENFVATLQQIWTNFKLLIWCTAGLKR